MQEREKIKVWAKIIKGETKCLCPRNEKLCENRKCIKEEVYRDFFAGWEETFHRNKYGQ